MRKRRVFSTAEKIELLEEAKAAGFLPTARKHGFSSTAVLYKWRDELSEIEPIEIDSTDDLASFNALLSPALAGLARDLQSRRISSTSAISSLSRLINASKKLDQLNRSRQRNQRRRPASSPIQLSQLQDRSSELREIRNKVQGAAAMVDQKAGLIDKLPAQQKYLVQHLLSGFDLHSYPRPVPRFEDSGLSA